MGQALGRQAGGATLPGVLCCTLNLHSAVGDRSQEPGVRMRTTYAEGDSHPNDIMDNYVVWVTVHNVHFVHSAAEPQPKRAQVWI